MNPTPEQVAQWAREAGVFRSEASEICGMWPVTEAELTRLVTRAMAAQAEADAKLCDSLEFEFRPGVNCAAAIRANAPKVTT